MNLIRMLVNLIRMSAIKKSFSGMWSALVLLFGVGLSGVPVESIAQGGATCGSLKNAYGPFDYSDAEARQNRLAVVEKYHFTPEVEQLRRGESGSIAGDLDYTLRAFPNHHRALNALARYSLQGKGMHGAHYSVDCYFDRAMRWRPEDPVVRMIYGNLLSKRGDVKGAREQYEAALKYAPNSAEVNYNAGLFFVSQGDYSRARKCAQAAYAAGYPLPGLKNKLQEAGQWSDQ